MRAIFEGLMGFDTVSSKPNMGLMDYVQGLLAKAGIDAVLPTITGRAWVTGIGQYMLDPSDPYPTGFTL